MQEDFLGPWNIERDFQQSPSTSRNLRLSHSLVKIQQSPPLPTEKKNSTSRPAPKKPHKDKPIQARSNLAQSCMNLNIKCTRKKVDESPVISPRMNKKVRSLLKMQAKKLQGQELNFPLKQPSLKMPQLPLKFISQPSQITQKTYSCSQKQTKPTVHRTKSPRRKIQTRGKMFRKMLADEFVLLNQKIQNIFHIKRANNPIQININKHLNKHRQSLSKC